jgi:hypothetical protein
MSPASLRCCLDDGLSPQDWYELINRRVFFWPTIYDLQVFLAAKEYKNAAHIVIGIPTARLLEEYGSRVTLSAINSGSTYYNPERFKGPARRGRSTFQPVNGFSGVTVKEVVVQDGITDVAGLGATVDRWIAHRQRYEAATFERLSHVWPAD